MIGPKIQTIDIFPVKVRSTHTHNGVACSTGEYDFDFRTVT
jgi:hypothetical protein